ncbi:MAG TPA: hypothetical protein DCF68_04590 [Cyanothece sp. UBA12306]|nr:hypothetical protein [Cyanothece sp. UBA12306]
MRKLMLGSLFALSSLLTVICYPSSADQLTDERSFFTKSPRLINVMTTFDGTRVQGATYYYTINLPSQSGESLQYITIQKRQGSENIDYFIDKTSAFEGTTDNRGKALVIQDVNWDQENESIKITLDTLVSPGTTFTIGLKPKKNPEYGGIYLFGITVFPRGENPLGLYLGNGRLQFYGGDDGGFD